MSHARELNANIIGLYHEFHTYAHDDFRGVTVMSTSNVRIWHLPDVMRRSDVVFGI